MMCKKSHHHFRSNSTLIHRRPRRVVPRSPDTRSRSTSMRRPLLLTLRWRRGCGPFYANFIQDFAATPLLLREAVPGTIDGIRTLWAKMERGRKREKEMIKSVIQHCLELIISNQLKYLWVKLNNFKERINMEYHCAPTTRVCRHEGNRQLARETQV